MFRKIINFVILLPLAVVLILLSVANRNSVTLALNPFRPEDSVLSLQAPFFVFLFLALMTGILLGSAATWLAQGKYRKQARSLREDQMKWQNKAAPVPRAANPAQPSGIRQIEA